MHGAFPPVPGIANPRFAQFPRALARRARVGRLGARGQIPALLVHPDWNTDAQGVDSPRPTPRPTILWMHGRTVSKELDPGRYLRFARAGIATCALDLPGHGERLDPSLQSPEHTLDVIAQMVAEIDEVIAGGAGEGGAGERAAGGLAAFPEFDLSRLAIGGMSAGGMVTLRRLCAPSPTPPPHAFTCATVEGSTGWLSALYFPHESGLSHRVERWAVEHDPAKVAAIDPMNHLDAFTPLPLLALHSEADAIVPIEGQRRFLDALRAKYLTKGAPGSWIRLQTWPSTGAPQEHAGFGRVATEAKTIQTEFLAQCLGATPVAD